MKNKDSVLSSPTEDAQLPNFIASNLRLLRKRAGWSQSELAARVGLNRGNIASYECGSAEPSICKLLRFSNVFDISTRDFTRLDLSDPAELALARSARLSEEAERLNAYRERQAELSHLIDSSHDLFQYKRDTLDKPCKEAELFAGHYLQLLELSRQLMKEHETLLEELGCQCK
ncbi:helix-turn-helix domain-containing protein [Lewinella sp. IMCC34183]|uniref:helix-turn-helix domain-containing protein n=1 Tax=Lewinella sp. IMCC34183 TaxID=2248762 RepID=UPI000E27AB44|nr:helix-turn-helix transcriptional regulator [Lewinella sp. IMCC34183]